MFPAGCLTQGQPFSSASIRSNSFTFFLSFSHSCGGKTKRINLPSTLNITSLPQGLCDCWLQTVKLGCFLFFFGHLVVVFCIRCCSSHKDLIHEKVVFACDLWGILLLMIFRCTLKEIVNCKVYSHTHPCVLSNLYELIFFFF